MPVRIREETDRSVEGEIGRHSLEALRIEWQNGLQPQDQIKREEPKRTEGQHRKAVGQPALLFRVVHTSETIETSLDWPHKRVYEGALAREDP